MPHRTKTVAPNEKWHYTSPSSDMDREYCDAVTGAFDSGEVLPFAKSMRGTAPVRRQVVVAVVEGGVSISQRLWRFCEFLDIALVRVPSHADLASVLQTKIPMVVVCALNGAGQEGCHIMKTLAHHDASVPMMIITGDDLASIGAADALEEIWQLTEITKLETLPEMAGFVDFLIHTGRKGNCLGLKPAPG